MSDPIKLGIGDWGLGIAQCPIPNPQYIDYLNNNDILYE